MKNRDVAIVVPTYNAGPSLIDAIESVLDTTQLSIQIVVMEDGSENPSNEILIRRFSSLLENTDSQSYIQYQAQQNSGAYHARINALALCNSECVKFLDQDDVLISGALALEVAAFDDSTDVVMSNWKINHHAEGRIEHCNAPIYTDPLSDFLSVGGCFTSAALYRTSVAKNALKPVQSFTPIKADDWLIFAQVCMFGARYKTIDIDSYIWNQHGEQLSKKAADRLLSEHYHILNYCEEQLVDTQQLTQKRKNLLANYYAKQLLSSYEKDALLFEKVLDKIKNLNPTYRNQHGHKIYRLVCKLFGLKRGTIVYSQLKRFFRA